MDALEEIHLTGHVLNGSLPAALGALPNLKVLHLSGPASAGAALPQSWSSMAQLRSLVLLNMGNVQGKRQEGVSPPWFVEHCHWQLPSLAEPQDSGSRLVPYATQ